MTSVMIFVIKHWRYLAGAAVLAFAGLMVHAYGRSRYNAGAATVQAKNLAAEISAQNEAVENLSKDAKAREDRARAALASAETARVDAERRAQDLLSMTQPQGVDACVAASALIRRELGK